MDYRTISTVITDFPADKMTLNDAIALARQNDAHLEIFCLGIDRLQPGFFYAGAGVQAMATQSGMVEAEKNALELRDQVTAHMSGQGIQWTERAIAAQSTGLPQFLAHRIRFCDIAVLPQPYEKTRASESEAIVESALFDAQVPVWITPPAAKPFKSIKSVVVAWNESRESLVAIRAALPFLIAAEQVDIAIIDPPQHGVDRSDPGGALSQMLARHGVRPQVSVLAKTLPRVSDVLGRHLLDQNADLLVMGAYGHSRLRESIVGGTTRHILETADFPVLMAH